MPSTMTHAYFGYDVYQKLSLKCQKKIENKLDYFKLFCQGSDPFMFYPNLLGKESTKVRHLQEKMHFEKTQDYFLNMIRFIHNNNLINEKEAMAYLYGYICHYYLDLYTHPFVIYKTGIFKKGDKDTYRYNGIHQEMEFTIDRYFIHQRENIPYSQFKVSESIFNVTSFSDNLKKLIDYAVFNTYLLKNAFIKYRRSIWGMKMFFRIATYDPLGVKLRCYQVIDNVLPDRIVRIQSLSYYNDYNKKVDYLNLEHKKWCYPWDDKQIFYTSFLDLYNMALEETIVTIEYVTNLLENKKLDIGKLKKIFNNLSFATGKPCSEKVNFKYFDF